MRQILPCASTCLLGSSIVFWHLFINLSIYLLFYYSFWPIFDVFAGWLSLLHCRRIDHAYFPDSDSHQGSSKEAEWYVLQIYDNMIWRIDVPSRGAFHFKYYYLITLREVQKNGKKRTVLLHLEADIFPDTGLTSFLLLSALPAAFILICYIFENFGEHSTISINIRKINHSYQHGAFKLSPGYSKQLFMGYSPSNNFGSRSSFFSPFYLSQSSEVNYLYHYTVIHQLYWNPVF